MHGFHGPHRPTVPGNLGNRCAGDCAGHALSKVTFSGELLEELKTGFETMPKFRDVLHVMDVDANDLEVLCNTPPRWINSSGSSILDSARHAGLQVDISQLFTDGILSF